MSIIVWETIYVDMGYVLSGYETVFEIAVPIHRLEDSDYSKMLLA